MQGMFLQDDWEASQLKGGSCLWWGMSSRLSMIPVLPKNLKNKTKTDTKKDKIISDQLNCNQEQSSQV